tara:strand:- start:7011 stop:7427 length:417 start_codon:yes stop_codon:yes gene_type:complete
MFNFYERSIVDRFDANKESFYFIDDQFKNIKDNILDLKTRSAQAISSNELRNAYISIEDNKRFFEYEIKMSKKSIQEFVDKLNQDMERLHKISNQSQSNDKNLQEQLKYVIQELEMLKIQKGDGLQDVSENVIVTNIE